MAAYKITPGKIVLLLWNSLSLFLFFFLRLGFERSHLVPRFVLALGFY